MATINDCDEAIQSQGGKAKLLCENIDREELAAFIAGRYKCLKKCLK